MITNSLTTAQKLVWKQQLKAACIDILEQRIAHAEQAMQSAQESANNEEKSSVGDKYEVSRAMSHLDSEVQAHQLEETRFNLGSILSLNTDTLHNCIDYGRVVVCKGQILFIALGLGATVIQGQKVMLLSPLAPVAVLLQQKKAGDSIILNGKTIDVVDVF